MIFLRITLCGVNMKSGELIVGFMFKFLFRPLQFNYLSYELFLEKKSCQTPKKKKKKSPLVSYGRKWF